MRVAIDFPLQGSFSAQGLEISGHLADMSLSGISMKVPVKPTGATDIAGQFNCLLPNGKLEVAARLLKVVEGEHGCRAIVTFTPDSKLELLISQFIFGLQVDIIRDLKDQYL